MTSGIKSYGLIQTPGERERKRERDKEEGNV